MEIKPILGVVATGIAFVSYVPYIRDILANKTKLHAFSWLVWGILTAISFAAQVTNNAGPGAWVMGFTAVVDLVIFTFALVKGKKNIVMIDWVVLTGAGLAMFMWYITKTPLISVVLITLTDALGFAPTFRKSFVKPWEETLSTYALSGMKFVVAIFALESFSLVTGLYPVYLVLANASFVGMLLWRRGKLKANI